MSKLTRALQKVFGASAPSTQIGKFGSLAAGTPSTTNDPVQIQSLSNYDAGWFNAILGGNSPALEDRNALDFLFSRQLAYLLERGLAEYDASTTYYRNAVVQYNGAIYLCNYDGLLASSPDVAGWRRLRTLNPQVSAKIATNAMTFTGTTTLPTGATGLSALAWSPELGLLVGVGNVSAPDTEIYTSPDGKTWTVRTAAGTGPLEDVCWSPQLRMFVAVASSGSSQVQYSADGVTWTSVAGTPAGDWNAVCWSADLRKFVAVGLADGTNHVMYSPDGLTWTAATSAANTTDWLDVKWVGNLGLFVACGVNSVMTSPDGITWTLRTTGVPTGNWAYLAHSEDLGMIVGVSNLTTASQQIMYSYDGINWTGVVAPAANGWCGVDWSPELGLFVAAAFSGTARMMYSRDGINWTATIIGAAAFRAIKWCPQIGIFVLSSASRNMVYSGYAKKLIC